MEGQGFRPSPNFKHMKKYQKAKAHLSSLVEDPTPATSISPVEEPKPAEPVVEEPPPPEVKQEPCVLLPLQQFEEQPPQLFEDQPPLPPDIKPPLMDFKPPPDMYPPPLPVNSPPVDIKEEMEDDEIHYVESDMQYMDYEEVKSVETQPTEIMCRNYFRGVCNRGSTCIYAHRVIMAQLKDVYRFCNDFQNSICKRPRCKFVHATVFEKENFLRTGFLPEHTMAHFNESLSVLPPPPPPPPQEPVSDVQRFYTIIPPPPPPPPPVTDCVQVPKDPMRYAPGPSSYQAAMQTSKQTPYQIMQTPIMQQMQAMQTSNLTPVHTMDTSLPSAHHVMQSPMLAPVQPMQAPQLQVPVQSMQVPIQIPTQSPMQAPLQPIQLPIQTSTQPPHQVMQGPPTVDIYANPIPGTSSSTPHWPQFEPRPSTSHEKVAKSATTCHSCEINDFRLKYTMNKNEKLRRENEEMDRKIAEIELKKQVIYIFLAKIFQTNRTWCNTSTTDNERQRALMEQLSKLLSSGQL